MKIKIMLTTICGGLALTSAAYAQDKAPDAAPPAATAPSAAFGIEDVQKFVTVSAELRKIQDDATLAQADKQQRMAEVVRSQGLEIQRYNEIAEAAQTNPGLQKQIQDLSAQHQQ